jgi:hypothetical protein
MRTIFFVMALLCLISPAQARHRQAVRCVESPNLMVPVCGMIQPFSGAVTIKVTMHKERNRANPRARQARETASYGRANPGHSVMANLATTQIVPHPVSCPRTRFCGCGAAVRVFGHSVRELWLAANWFKFPRAVPASGMVAVRRHHVMVLEADLGGGLWRVFDANAGHHLTFVHARSIAGYVIVNPHAG